MTLGPDPFAASKIRLICLVDTTILRDIAHVRGAHFVIRRVLALLFARTQQPELPGPTLHRHDAGAGLSCRIDLHRQRVGNIGGIDRGIRLRMGRPFLDRKEPARNVHVSILVAVQRFSDVLPIFVREDRLAT